MFTRFGSREICNVTFKALTARTIGGESFEAGQPVFVIDTATASSMEQATTTVYAQGGRGYNRLIAWEGEKTVTFTVTDALLSPMALSVLSGAAISKAGPDKEDIKHIHVSLDAVVGKESIIEVSFEKLKAELGLENIEKIEICKDPNIKTYAALIDHNGSVIAWKTATVEGDGVVTPYIPAKKEPSTEEKAAVPAKFKVADAKEGAAVKLDFYVILKEKASQITIAPDSFGGYFYVEADTLFRDQDGRDLAATLTFPKVKIQSNFTISMAPNGDPQTYDFVMDAMPAYTYFDNTKKVVCDMVIIGAGTEEAEKVSHVTDHTSKKAQGSV